MKRSTRIMSWLMCLLLLLTLMPLATFAAEDTRTVISVVTGTSNMGAPAYGDVVQTAFDFTFTEGTQCSVPGSMGYWEKKNGESWEGYNSSTFTEGTYRYSNQLRLNSPLGQQYKFDETVEITIDGKQWTHGTFYDYNTYLYGYMTSPEFTVEWKKIPLVFNDSYSFDIRKAYANTTIAGFSVAEAVVGGVAPYTFSKTSGPAWINVAADGTVSGTPTVVEENDDLVIRVTDSEGDFQEITVWVTDTLMDPALRTKIDTVVGTSNIGTPAYGDAVKTAFDFTFTVGAGCNVPGSMGYWEKKNGESWERYNGVTFVEGTYRYSNQLRIDGSNGAIYQFADEVSITIDGQNWTNSDFENYDSYCYGYMTSPEFTIELPPVPELLFIDSNEYDIPQGYADRAIASFSVADAVSGGVAPYTFSKEFGPAWLNVAADGTVSGTPTASDYTQSATLRVTDAEGSYKEIIISIAVIYINPENREEIKTIVATSNMVPPSYGEEVKDVTFSITEGGEARFGSGSLQGWYVKDGENWVAYGGDTFEAGTYRYQNPIYVDGSVGHTHQLAAPLSVTVDGTAWEVGEITVEDDRSYVVVASPEIEVHKCTVVLGQKASCTTDGWNDYYDCVCGKHFEDMAATIEIADLEAWKIGEGKIAAGHIYGDLKPAQEAIHTATVLKGAVDAHYFCDECDTYFDSNKNATTLDALTGDAPSHSGGTATCNAKAKCSTCGASYGEVNKNNHSALTTLKAVSATCSKTGLTEGKKCTACGVVTVAQKTVAKKAHTYKSVTTKATTSKNGSVVKKCSVCGSQASKTTIYYAKKIKLSTTKYTYNGKARKPSVTVYDYKGNKISSSNYTVSYASGCKYVGKYKVTIKFKSKYSGTLTTYFTIIPKESKVSSLTAGKKSLKVKLSKVSSQASGYEIQYSTSKKFTSAKTKKVTSYKTTSVTLKSLKAKKTYYVRVRTYKTVNGTKYYSGWSTYKYKKTK